MHGSDALESNGGFESPHLVRRSGHGSGRDSGRQSRARRKGQSPPPMRLQTYPVSALNPKPYPLAGSLARSRTLKNRKRATGTRTCDSSIAQWQQQWHVPEWQLQQSWAEHNHPDSM